MEAAFRVTEGRKSGMNWLRFGIVALTTAILGVAYYFHRTFQNGFGLVFAGLAFIFLALDLKKAK